MPLTLMAVHAHPDDECIGTGGVLARYSAEGVRTVLVTCTDGGCGDGAGGSKPGDAGHDRAAVVKTRRAELDRSCEALGITHLERLDYGDSGMMGWPQNDEPGSFWTTPVADAADRLVELFRRYEPQVVVTYNELGMYGHPDHIQAHRITVAADRLTGIPAKLYYTAVPRSAMLEMGRRMQELGVELPQEVRGDSHGAEPELPDWLTPDEELTTVVDVSAYTDAKFDSLRCHESQSDNVFFLRMGRDVFGQLLTREAFVRAFDRTNAPLPEDDLFAGLR